MPGDRLLTSNPANSLDAEESRIKGAYAKRQTGVDQWLYSPFNKGNLFIMQELERGILALLERWGRRALDKQRILEIGCGGGYWVREFVKWGARPENLAGVDLLPDRIEEAKRLCPDGVTFHCGSATKLQLPDATFDLVLQSTVFTSILDAGMKQRIAFEMLRVLKTDGVILWCDFSVNNPRNPEVRGVNRKEISQLFPHCQIELRRITLAPPIARLIAPYSWLACYLLAQVPFLCTHYLGVIRKG